MSAQSATAAEWRAERVATAAPVESIEIVDRAVLLATSAGWFRIVAEGNAIRLEPAPAPRYPPLPKDALPDGRIAAGSKDIARAWLADPSRRYGHGVLGDAVEAGSLVIERRDGLTETVTLGTDAVFEDLAPRIADLDGDGRDEVIIVKSYLKAGSALAVIGTPQGRAAILAETRAIGTPNRWLNPAGIADFDGDGATDIALVAMPHAVGRLELWTWRGGRLSRTRTLDNASNHIIGSRALGMSAAGDFDGDGVADLAIPSFDRRALRLISFAGKPRDIAAVTLPARAKTNIGMVRIDGAAVLMVGLEDGQLVVVRR